MCPPWHCSPRGRLRNLAPSRAPLHGVDGRPSATRAGLSPLASAKEHCRTDRGAAPSEHCNGEVIDYFGRCVEPAAQADVGSDGRGRPSPAWRTVMADRLPPGILSSTTVATGPAAYRQAGMRARMPHGRAETAVHGAVARMTTKGPQEITVRARHGRVVADLASRRTLISSHHI